MGRGGVECVRVGGRVCVCVVECVRVGGSVCVCVVECVGVVSGKS